MQSKVSAFVARVGEAGWLAALLIVPLLFNLYSERLFEEDKIPLMRAIAMVVAVALVVGVAERGRAALRPNGEPLWRLPAVPAALALLAAYALSTLFSVAPRLSLWGAYIRRQGLLTWLAYVVFFVAILLWMRRRPQVGRLVTTILMASIPAALYAILQNRGLDPLPWGGDVVRRASSTAGNPIFIGAYLIMVIPLTLARLIEPLRALVRRDDAADATGRPALMAGLYLFLLIVQLLALIFSQSRGPLLGLLVGLTLFGTLLALRRSRALTLAIAAAAVGGTIFLILFNQPGSPLAPLREAPYIGRLGRLFEVESGTGRVRALIWEGDAALLGAASPGRLLVGYGPDAMFLAYNRFYPPALAQVEKRTASPDRSHNETFDALVTLGVVGLAAQLALFLSLFYAAFRWLGMIRTPRHRSLFLGGAVLLGALGWLLPLIVDGTTRYSGVGLPAALTGWLLLYVLGFALTHLREPAPPLTAESVLVVALLSALVAHFVEIHFGIAIGVTRLYFWLYAGLLVVLVSGLVADEAPVAASSALRVRRGASGAVPAARGTAWALGLAAGLMLIVLAFDFVTPLVPLEGPVVALIVASWLLAGALVVGESAGPWPRAAGRYAAASLLPPLLFLLLYLLWSRATLPSGGVTIEALLAHGSRVANNLTILYLAVMLWLLAVGWWMARGEGQGRLRGGPRLALYALLALALPLVIVRTNLDVSRADSLSKQGSGYERAGEWEVASRFYERALALQPNEDRYFLNLGRAELELGRRASGPEREAHLARAEQVLTRAQAVNPLNTDHARNLASLHRVWAGLASDDETRRNHQALAARYYEEATSLSPNNARLLNEWATLLGEMDDPAGARALLDRSLALDSLYVDTYLLLANQAILEERYDEALAHYDEALALDPDSRAARGGAAYVYSLKGDPQEAIRRYEAILVDLPDDYVSLKNLAVLYRDAGDRTSALDYARRALVGAPDNERAAIEALVAELAEAAP